MGEIGRFSCNFKFEVHFELQSLKFADMSLRLFRRITWRSLGVRDSICHSHFTCQELLWLESAGLNKRSDVQSLNDRNGQQVTIACQHSIVYVRKLVRGSAAVRVHTWAAIILTYPSVLLSELTHWNMCRTCAWYSLLQCHCIPRSSSSNGEDCRRKVLASCCTVDFSVMQCYASDCDSDDCMHRKFCVNSAGG